MLEVPPNNSKKTLVGAIKWHRNIVEYRVSGGSLTVIARIVFWVLLGTVLLLPLPFGSIFPRAYTLLAVIVAFLVVIWSVTLAVAGDPPPVTLG